MSIHPWHYSRDNRAAWKESWYDYVMTQCGHGELPSPGFYREIAVLMPTKPIVESECQYEGLRKLTAHHSRTAAYRALLSGAYGFTYGAHGLWFLKGENTGERFSNWGPAKYWWEALRLPGGEQMRLIRNSLLNSEWEQYQTIHHIRPSEPCVPSAHQAPIARASNDRRYIIYFPSVVDGQSRCHYELHDVLASTVHAVWVNPREGYSLPISTVNRPKVTNVFLPNPPDSHDWLLILRVH
jgi:hypothetical protein